MFQAAIGFNVIIIFRVYRIGQNSTIYVHLPLPCAQFSKGVPLTKGLAAANGVRLMAREELASLLAAHPMTLAEVLIS